jgi:streptomycin 6-kinase
VIGFALPANFVQIVTTLHEGEGVAWLARLPAIVAECAQRWSLRVEAPFPNLSYHYVAPARCADGTAAVLKLGVPGDTLLARESLALRLYAGRGAARVLAGDPALGALLLERLVPGTPLRDLALRDDARATAIAAEVMRRLWPPLPAEHPFPSVADWARGLQRLRAHFAGGAGPLPARLVDQAERRFAELLASSAPPVLLHGDLHHANILAAARAPWLAIDPQGVAGEPAYETGALLRNPVPDVAAWPDLPRVLARRVDQLAETLGFERERVRGWGIAQAVLSAWWSIEDHGAGWEPASACAEALAAGALQ